jgi:hypothetical protein
MPSTAKPKTTHVWALYENHPGEHGKLVGLFSSLNRAKGCALIQPLLQGDWTPREGHGSYIWVASALDAELDPPQSFHFSVQEVQIDRLVE